MSNPQDALPPPGSPGRPSQHKLPLVLGIAAVVAVAAALWLLVLGDDDDDASVTPAPDDLTEEDLDAVLLQADDLGDGFVETYRGEALDDGDDDTSDGFPADCQQVMDEVTVADDGTTLELIAEFIGPGGAEVEHSVNPVRRVDVSVDDFVSAIQDSCSGTMSVTEAGFTYEVELEAARVDGLGEEAFSIGLTVDHPMIPGQIESYQVNFARDGIASLVRVETSFNDETLEVGPLDEDLAHELSELVDRRIQANT